MFDSRGLPDYPPPYNAWQFPPPKVSSRWKWAAIGASVFGLVAGTTLLVVTIAVGSSGLEGVIDDPDLISVIETQCDKMTTTVEALPIHGTARRQGQSILRQNDAIRDMISGITATAGPELLADDPPSREWLADWSSLSEARETYAIALMDGEPATLELPMDDRGRDIYVRMDDAFLDGSTCRVPEVLVNPEPDDASGV